MTHVEQVKPPLLQLKKRKEKKTTPKAVFFEILSTANKPQQSEMLTYFNIS